MAWRRSRDKPLSEWLLFYWRIYTSRGLNELKEPNIDFVMLYNETSRRGFVTRDL